MDYLDYEGLQRYDELIKKDISGKISDTYAANLNLTTTANYITEPEFKSIKINGATTNSTSSENCILQYDTTNKCLKFIFN